MHKRLVRVGNSLAIVIDRALLKVLRLTQMSRLSVAVEGNRIVITPVAGSGDPRPPSKREAQQILHELQQIGFTQKHFDQVAAEPMQIGRYVLRLDGTSEASGAMAVTMRRMSEVRRLLREGWNVRHAFATAIAANPHELPTGIETRFSDEEVADADEEAEERECGRQASPAIRDAQAAQQEREAQRLAQEARDRYA